MRWRDLLLNSVLLSGGLLAFLAAQTTAPFVLLVQQGTTVATVASGTTITMAATGIGKPLEITVTAIYRGTAIAVVTRVDLFGSPDFSASSLPKLPLVLTPEQQFKCGVRFQPSSGAGATATLQITYNEISPGKAPGPQSTVVINLVGVAPEITLAYVLQTDSNVVALTPGGSIGFPETKVASTTSAVVVVLNRGSGPANIKAITLTGSADFQLLGVPLLPGSLSGGSELRVTVRYSPQQSGAASAKLQIALEDRTLDVTLQGLAVGPSFVYELIEGPAVTPLVPNQPLVLSETFLGQTRSFVVRVRNTGNGEGQIASISLLGLGFQLTDVPFLPTTLAPGSSLFFGLNFAPAQTGAATGRLRVGNDTFELKANVLGSRLTYSYTVGAATYTVQPNGTVGFSPVAVGLASEVRFTVANEGASAVTVTGIGVAGAGFKLGDLPPLPANLAAGQRIAFSIFFTPAAIGAATGTLRIDALNFLLSGSGTAPPPLPGVRFEGAKGLLEPLQQPATGIALEEPYALPLKGVLTLTIDSESFVADPAVQFSTGGRSISFTIPAGSTRAVFSNGALEVRFQTGTVASTIRLATSIVTEAGLDLTPQPPPAVTVTIASLPPRLLEGRLEAKSANSLTLAVTGYTTGRTLTRLDLEFTAAEGYKLSSTRWTLNIESAATLWYRSGASSAYGGLFTAAIPFTVQGEPEGTKPLTDGLQSVTIAVGNELGNSNSVTINVR